jgi:hypothetical protein
MADPLEDMFGTKEKKKKVGALSEKDMKRLREYAKRDDSLLVLLDAYENGDFSPSIVKELTSVLKDRQSRGKNALEAKKQVEDYNNLLDKILTEKTYESATGTTGAIVDSFLGGVARKASSVFDRDGRTIGGDLAQLQRIKGAEFAKAFETLKGAGAVSNLEGATMLQKFTSLFDENGDLRKDMSEEEFKAEIERLKAFTDENLSGFNQSYTFDPETGDILSAEEYANIYGNAPAETVEVPEERPDGSLTTGQTVDTMVDLTNMAPDEMKAQWDAFPSGTIYMYNGKKKRKR